MKNPIILLFVCLFFIYGCDKFDDKPAEKPGKKIYTVSESMKEYFVNFDTGTLWIYKNYNYYDTLCLKTKIQFEDTIDWDGYEGIYHWYELEFYRYHVNRKVYSLAIYPSNKENSEKITLTFEDKSPDYFELNDGRWLEPTEYYTEMTIGSTNYKDVLYQKYAKASLKEHLAMAKNFGMVNLGKEGYFDNYLIKIIKH